MIKLSTGSVIPLLAPKILRGRVLRACVAAGAVFVLWLVPSVRPELLSVVITNWRRKYLGVGGDANG